jgi:hypothetical protein
MIFKVQVPKGTHVKIGERLTTTRNFDKNDFIGLSIVKEIINDTEILCELNGVELESGGIIDKGSFILKEVSIVVQQPIKQV